MNSLFSRASFTLALGFTFAHFLTVAEAACPSPGGCEAGAGTISTEFNAGCLVNGHATVTAVPDGNAVVPAGFSVLYLLTQTNGLFIQAVSTVPTFTVSSLDIHRIHTLVYDPATLDISTIQFGETSVFNLLPLFVGHGGDICAALDLNGAPFKVQECPCEADAGTISIEFDAGCLVNGEATVTATPDGNAVVPAGFSVLYLLTQTNGLFIQAVSSVPTFTVNSLDIHRIHTLVYDPATLDISTIQYGETSVFNLLPLFIAGGGDICASIVVNGAPFKVQECGNICTADAGSISADQPDLCLIDGEASLTATAAGDAVVPSGYSLLYVLTRGPGLIIEQVSPTPSFSITMAGQYTIHTLVYDPATLDPGIIALGETTGFDVNTLLIQGGGTICGSLDVLGAEFQVADCTPVCTANAGTIAASAADLCLTEGQATLEALPNGDQTIPTGYSVVYVLTQGVDLVIQQVSTSPSFTVTAAGPYTIHTLVYDPASLDLGIVVSGETTGFDVNTLLIQGGGTICGSLDILGAEFQVADCTPLCTAYAGSDAQLTICSSSAPLALFTLLGPEAWTGGSWTGPNGLPHPGIFLPGVDMSGTYTYLVSDTEPCPGDEAQVNIVVNMVPNAGTNGSVSICSDGTPMALNDLLGNASGTSGTWYAPDGTEHSGTFTPGADVAGIYTYVVEGTAPCANDTATVLVNVVIAPDAGVSAQMTICDNAAPVLCLVLLGGDVDPGGQWTGPNGAPFNGVFDSATDPAGIYTYTVSGVAPCASDQAMLAISVQNCCNAGVNTDTTVCFTDLPFLMIDALGGDPCPDGNWTDPPNQQHSGFFDPATDISGVYTYSVPGPLGEPPLTATLTVIVIECPGVTDATPDKWTTHESASTSTSVADHTGNTTLSLWPNPALDVVTVALPFTPSQRTRVELIDELGRSTTVPMTFTANAVQLDVRSIAAGAWVLRIVDGEHTALARFVHTYR